MHRRAREVMSSAVFLALLAVVGLLLLSWPMVTVLASLGSFGQLLSLFIAWLVLVLGCFVWSRAQEGGRECPDDASDNTRVCDAPARNRQGR